MEVFSPVIKSLLGQERKVINMALEKADIINSWTEDDLDELPKYESDLYEYKSKLVSFDKLVDKISIAASAFWNTGGGIFIVGIDDNGEIDGGIPMKNGKTKVSDWVDKVISNVEPIGTYYVKTIKSKKTDSRISKDCVVLVIAFERSHLVPHMAQDKKYYIRVGAHSIPANHYIIEALRSYRNQIDPTLRAILRMHPSKPDIVQLVITSISEGAALDVEISFEPLPKIFDDVKFKGNFPLEVPLIDRQNPFCMEISLFPGGYQVFGDVPVTIKVNYKSISGKDFEYSQVIDPKKNLSPLKFGSDNLKEIKKSLDKVEATLSYINRSIIALKRKEEIDDET